MTREERRAAAKAKKDAKRKAATGRDDSSSEDDDSESDDPATANPNHTASARVQAASAPIIPDKDAPPPEKGGSKEGLSRREREAIEAARAKERYLKLHAEGKTDEARADLARLALIKEKREAEAARKKAEKEEKDEKERERRKELDEREEKRRQAAMGPGKKGKGKK
jgi:hypothetical protein